MQTFINSPLHLVQERLKKISKKELKSCSIQIEGSKINISLDLKDKTNLKKFFESYMNDYEVYVEKSNFVFLLLYFIF